MKTVNEALMEFAPRKKQARDASGKFKEAELKNKEFNEALFKFAPKAPTEKGKVI